MSLSELLIIDGITAVVVIIMAILYLRKGDK